MPDPTPPPGAKVPDFEEQARCLCAQLAAQKSDSDRLLVCVGALSAMHHIGVAAGAEAERNARARDVECPECGARRWCKHLQAAYEDMERIRNSQRSRTPTEPKGDSDYGN